jgi:molecular chaperone IbpA
MLNEVETMTIPTIFETLDAFEVFDAMLDSVVSKSSTTFPPYDIVRVMDSNVIRLQLALAGYDPSDVNITVRDHTLTVSGERPKKEDVSYIYNGIAHRKFDARFRLGEHVEPADAEYKNGILTIFLEKRVPEEKTLKRLEIKKAA